MRWRFWQRPLAPPPVAHRDAGFHPAQDQPGWETSCGEFRQLLGDLQWRAVVAPLLKQWYGCSVIGPKGRPEIRAASGEIWPLDDVHRWIQNDPDLRYDFYQRKMSCFHWDDFAERLYAEYLSSQQRRA